MEYSNRVHTDRGVVSVTRKSGPYGKRQVGGHHTVALSVGMRVHCGSRTGIYQDTERHGKKTF